MINIGDKIDNKYRLTSRIGKGGMAEVYEAISLVDKKTYAIKFLLENMLKNETNIRRFAHEAKVTEKLHHDNIVSIFDSGVYQNRPYIVLEYIKGQNLAEKLKLGGKISYVEACEIVAQVCSVLIYIHNKGIIHRDIKPDNIFYSYNGEVKLSDFGIALDLTNKTKDDIALVGSVHYLAPEVYKTQDASKVTDIYALGITFYELVTRHLPFNRNDLLDVAVAQVNEEMPLPSSFAKDLPKPIEKVILKATMKNPRDRYQDASEMRRDILNILEDKNKYRSHRSLLQIIFGFKDN